MPKTTLEVLQGARNYLATPEHWFQGAYVGPKTSKPPEEWPCCLMGAIMAESLMGDGRSREEALDGAAEEEALFEDEVVGAIRVVDDCIATKFPNRRAASIVAFGAVAHIPQFNDAEETTHQEILKVLDCAIHAESEKVLVG